MTYLNKLKIIAQPIKEQMSPEQRRRLRVTTKLEEQLKMIEAEQKGETYVRTKWAWTKNENGEKQRIERPAKLKQWWNKDAKGNIVLCVRYGAKPLELQKGKTAVDVGKAENLTQVIRTLMQAIESGELDEELKVAAGERSPKRKQRAA